VARPRGLKPLVMRGLDREIERARAGEPAQVFLKMNSLTDRDVIDKIAEACEAGVRVIMIVRGICCIKANVPGKTDGLVVHQIVGRFLEHARVYAFGADIRTPSTSPVRRHDDQKHRAPRRDRLPRARPHVPPARDRVHEPAACRQT
jgi:polyphosphate kinase